MRDLWLLCCGRFTVADPDLQIRRGGGGGHPDPEIKGGGAVSKKFFSAPFGSQFGLKVSGGAPRICHLFSLGKTRDASFLFCIIAGHIQLMKLYYKSTSWTTYNLPQTLKKRGVDEVNKLPNFHYREDALKLWTAIEEFLKEILPIYYPSDDVVKKVRGA